MASLQRDRVDRPTSGIDLLGGRHAKSQKNRAAVSICGIHCPAVGRRDRELRDSCNRPRLVTVLG